MSSEAANTTIRVLHVIDHLGMGGAQSILADLCTLQTQGTRRVSHQVIVLHGDGSYAVRLNCAGIAVTRLASTKWNFPAIFFRLALRLWRQDFDVLQLHLPVSSALGCCLNVFSVIPVVVTVYATRAQFRGLGFYLFRLIAPLVQRFIALFEISRGELRALGIPDAKIQRVPIGIDLREADSSKHFTLRRSLAEQYHFDSARPLLLSIARLNVDRRTDLLILAMVDLVKTQPDVILLMVGEGPQRAELEMLVARHRLERNVIFVGERSDIWDIYAGCDLYVTVLNQCTLGVAAIQAMACARPTVGCNLSAMEDKLRYCGESHAYVLARDPRAMAEIIHTLLSQPDQAAALGLRGRAHVLAHHSIESMARQWHAVWFDVLRRE